MQIKINRLLVVLLASGVLLLFGGCSPTNTTQNNATLNSNNQNVSSTMTPTMTPPMVCTGHVNEQTLEEQITKLPQTLKDQFKETNPATGTISLSYPNNVLTFNGYITGKGNNLNNLIIGFDGFRGKNCAKIVSFQGETAGTSFEWRAESNSPTPPSNCKKDIEDAINNSKLASQINKNLYFLYDETSRVLTFGGYASDVPGKGQNGQFYSLFARLQQFMGNGCISKIVFAGQIKAAESKPTKDSKPMQNDAAFSWTLCQDPLCDCNGECVSSCPCTGANTNTNVNTNTLNTNANTNTNTR